MSRLKQILENNGISSNRIADEGKGIDTVYTADTKVQPMARRVDINIE